MAKRRKRSTRIPGLTFSAKRAFGVTKAKRSVAKFIGIPTTKSGRQRKLGRMMTGGSCLIQLALMATFFLSAVAVILLLIMSL